MGALLENYKDLLPLETLSRIRALADRFRGKSILHLRSGRLRPELVTMAEHLSALCEDLGLACRSATMIGAEEFFDHLGLSEEGPDKGPGTVPQAWKTFYDEVARTNARRMFLGGDLVVVHGLQPLGLIDHRRDDRPWVWRCHSDLSRAPRPLLSFAKGFASRYDGVVFSDLAFRPSLRPPGFVIAPSIDPLSPANEALTQEQIAEVLVKQDIPWDRPIVLQYLAEASTDEALAAIREWKTMVTPGEAFLVLLRPDERSSGKGSSSATEWEDLGRLYQGVRVFSLAEESARAISALGWAATLAIDNSHSRWPALGILDVMWKGKPVLVAQSSASAMLVDERDRFPADSRREFFLAVGDLTRDAELAREAGEIAHERVVERYLAPHHLLGYLSILCHFEKLSEMGKSE